MATSRFKHVVDFTNRYKNGITRYKIRYFRTHPVDDAHFLISCRNRKWSRVPFSPGCITFNSFSPKVGALGAIAYPGMGDVYNDIASSWVGAVDFLKRDLISVSKYNGLGFHKDELKQKNCGRGQWWSKVLTFYGISQMKTVNALLARWKR